MADAVGLAEREVAVADVELIAVEGANGRAGRPVALLVVLAAVARAAEAAGRQGRNQADIAGLRPLLDLLLVEDRPVRLHRAPKVGAAVREHGEAGHVVGEPVVADVGRAARDLAFGGIAQEGRDHELALLEVRDRPQVDLVVVRVLKHRSDREADDRDGDDARDYRTQAERGSFEEDAAREALARLRRGHPRFARGSRWSGGALGGGLGTARGGHGDDVRVAAVVTRGVAHPEEAEDDGDDDADRSGGPADDQADEDADDPDREADRPQARRRKVRFALALLGLHPRAPPFSRSPGRIQSGRHRLRQRRNRCRNALSTKSASHLPIASAFVHALRMARERLRVRRRFRAPF